MTHSFSWGTVKFSASQKFSKCNIIIPPMHMGTDMLIVSGLPVAKYLSYQNCWDKMYRTCSDLCWILFTNVIL
jgi:hypothetical protein